MSSLSATLASLLVGGSGRRGSADGARGRYDFRQRLFALQYPTLNRSKALLHIHQFVDGL
jgi:hypothetical protein